MICALLGLAHSVRLSHASTFADAKFPETKRCGSNDTYANNRHREIIAFFHIYITFNQ